MNLSVEDQFPSTGDCQMSEPPPIAGGQADWTLACIMNARARIERGHSTRVYAETDANVMYVCAMGALYVEAGIDPRSLDGPFPSGMKVLRSIEDQLTAEAKEAIDVVANAALELHPQSEGYGEWAGPLEWVNQDWVPEEVMTEFEKRFSTTSASILRPKHEARHYWQVTDLKWQAKIKAEILRIYDRAIEMRQGELVH